MSDAIKNQEHLLRISGRIYAAAKKFEDELSLACGEFWERIDPADQNNIKCIQRLEQLISTLRNIKNSGIKEISQLSWEDQETRNIDVINPRIKRENSTKWPAQEILAWILSTTLAATVLLLMLAIEPK